MVFLDAIHSGWPKGCAGYVGRRERECQVLGDYPEWPEEPWGEDIFIACTDNLTGFSTTAIEAVFPKAEIQNCIVHQIRNSTRYVSYKDLKVLVADLKAVYAAVDEPSALDAFSERWDKKYPKISGSWRDNWPNLSTYFKYPQEIRRLIYTTNAIEGFNRQLRKVTKAKSVFPSNNNLLKMLYLAMMDITKKWTGRRQDWSIIHTQLAVYFAERMPDGPGRTLTRGGTAANMTVKGAVFAPPPCPYFCSIRITLCGYTVFGTFPAPEVCPVCDHPQAYFEIHAENYGSRFRMRQGLPDPYGPATSPAYSVAAPLRPVVEHREVLMRSGLAAPAYIVGIILSFTIVFSRQHELQQTALPLISSSLEAEANHSVIR